MIASARMYAVSPAAAASWRTLLEAVIELADLPVQVIEHAPPESIETLWARSDLAAVFMCGLPYARTHPAPQLVAAPVPAPPSFGHAPCYWSEWVVPARSGVRTLAETFGGRLALTVAHSQSGCIAPLTHLARLADLARLAVGPSARGPWYREVIAPTETPLGALNALIEGGADVTAIDAFAWHLLERFRPELTAQVRCIERTARTAIPVIVAAPGTAMQHVQALREAFLAAHAVPALDGARASLLLERFVLPDAPAYEGLRQTAERTLAYWRSQRLALRIDAHFADLMAS